MEEQVSVSEIHRHPLRPVGFEEPLFLGRSAKKEIAEHLRGSSAWLKRASEAEEPSAAKPCHVLRRPDGSAYLVLVEPARSGCRRRRRGTRTRKRRVRSVVERWREVRGWWEPEGGTYRLCFRVLLGGSDGDAVVDLALDRRLGWSLTRVWD